MASFRNVCFPFCSVSLLQCLHRDKKEFFFSLFAMPEVLRGSGFVLWFVTNAHFLGVMRWSKATWLVELTQKWPSWITLRQLSYLESWLQGIDLFVIKTKMICMPSETSEVSSLFCEYFQKGYFPFVLFCPSLMPSLSSHSYLIKLSEMHLACPLGTWTKINKMWIKINNVEKCHPKKN